MEKENPKTVGNLLVITDFFIIKGGNQISELRERDRNKTGKEKVLIARDSGRAIHPRFPLDDFRNRFIKRTFDILLSTIVIVFILSWIIPLIALLIKLDSRGPVFFFQKRNNRGGGVFTCIKFRSMVVNSDADTLQAVADDKRITRVGKFLRVHYLDELPQFFNVWLGDMSVIGPRPQMTSDNIRYRQFIEFYDWRHHVKPGITGLAQILGYVGETSDIQLMRDRVQLDVYYVRHWSFLTDIKIITRTMSVIFFKQQDNRCIG